MQILANTVDKKLIYRIAILRDTCLLCGISHRANVLLELLRGNQIWNFSRIQNTVDVLKKRLDYNLGVGEKEHCGLPLRPCRLVQTLQVLTELIDAVSPCDFNLKALDVTHNACHPCERLFAAPADTDEEGIPAGLAQNSRNARDVLHSVHKKYKIHLLVRFEVVRVQIFVEHRGDLFHLKLVVRPILFRCTSVHVVSEENWICAKRLSFNLQTEVLGSHL
mmetsp:Transcript_8700/g.26128  ORF Transcript_8700/g.26128 Transcript_8700/m.26128 type:complete len:221 (+) Transcript_8700:7267-7929(+)